MRICNATDLILLPNTGKLEPLCRFLGDKVTAVSDKQVRRKWNLSIKSIVKSWSTKFVNAVISRL